MILMNFSLLILLDINECNSITDDCHHCTNTNGSYICTCDEGYELIGKDFCNG